MPQIEKHVVATHMRERAMFDEDQLQTLLTAHRHMLNRNKMDTAALIEKAIYAFRREEIEAFAYALEQHEAQRNSGESR